MAALVFVLTTSLGAWDDEWGTRIWTLTVNGRTIEIWREYAVLFALPVSVVAFLVGQAFGSPRTDVAVADVATSTAAVEAS